MKVYQLVFDSDNFQDVFQKDHNLRMRPLTQLGRSRFDIWPAHLEFEIPKPKNPKGLFLQWSSGEFILASEAQADRILMSLLTVDAEFLPVVVDAQPLVLHNIIRFTNCIDYDRSQFGPSSGATPPQLLYPRFQISEVPLGIHFRLQEYPRPRYVATDPSLPPEKDFYQWYHKQGYQGLKFRLLWDSDNPDELTRFY